MKNTIDINTPIGTISMYKNDLFYHDMLYYQKNEYAEQSIIDNELKDIIKSSNFILDIGSHVGYHSVAYAKMNTNVKVLAFEAQKHIFELLQKNITQNNYQDRVTCINKAVGNTNRQINLTKYCDDGPTTSLSIEYGTDNIYNYGGINIGIDGEPLEMISIDSLNLEKVDYMKIDVEGAEWLVLMGAKETILKYKPTICFENLKNLSLDVLKKLGFEKEESPFDILKSYGYKNFTEIAYNNVIATI